MVFLSKLCTWVDRASNSSSERKTGYVFSKAWYAVRIAGPFFIKSNEAPTHSHQKSTTQLWVGSWLDLHEVKCEELLISDSATRFPSAVSCCIVGLRIKVSRLVSVSVLRYELTVGNGGMHAWLSVFPLSSYSWCPRGNFLFTVFVAITADFNRIVFNLWSPIDWRVDPLTCPIFACFCGTQQPALEG